MGTSHPKLPALGEYPRSDSLGTRFEAQLDDAVEETRSVLRT